MADRVQQEEARPTAEVAWGAVCPPTVMELVDLPAFWSTTTTRNFEGMNEPLVWVNRCVPVYNCKDRIEMDPLKKYHPPGPSVRNACVGYCIAETGNLGRDSMGIANALVWRC